MYKVLIIDDDDLIQKVLKHALSDQGYTCSSAGRIEEGIKACAHEKPDLIVLDVNLPDGSGFDACRRIKALPGLRHIPLLMVTGEAVEVERKLEAFEAGADDYVKKPFSAKEVAARAKRLIAQAAKPQIA
jgi:DNA-binding response OmpR family regulator